MCLFYLDFQKIIRLQIAVTLCPLIRFKISWCLGYLARSETPENGICNQLFLIIPTHRVSNVKRISGKYQKQIFSWKMMIFIQYWWFSEIFKVFRGFAMVFEILHWTLAEKNVPRAENQRKHIRKLLRTSGDDAGTLRRHTEPARVAQILKIMDLDPISKKDTKNINLKKHSYITLIL